MERISVDRSDLEKLRDTVDHAVQHHEARDKSNAELHLAHSVRHSPLTSELLASRDRLDLILTEEDPPL